MAVGARGAGVKPRGATPRAGQSHKRSGYRFMKTTLTILLTGLLLCGCSQKETSPAGPTTPAGPAIDLVQAGKDSVWQGGTLLHVSMRDGASVEGIRLISTSSGGQRTTITADTGTLSPGTIEDAADQDSVKLTLHDAHGETLSATGRVVTSMKEMILVLKK